MKTERQKLIERCDRMTEADFTTRVEDCLRLFGWRWTHFRPARTEQGWRTALAGDKGFPDYCAVRESQGDEPNRLIFFEIKGDGGKLTPEQDEWIRLLSKTGAVVGVFWPRNWQHLEDLLRCGE